MCCPQYGENSGVFSYIYCFINTSMLKLNDAYSVTSVGISCRRLINKAITCTNPTCCLAAGKVKKAFFDKTGTLTTQGLHFVSAQRGDGVPVSSSGVSSPMEPLLQLGLAVCHTLTLSTTGDLVGRAVDREAFNAIPSAELLANGDVNFGGLIVKILKRFELTIIQQHKASLLIKDKRKS